jgi:hypothetical protein
MGILNDPVVSIHARVHTYARTHAGTHTHTHTHSYITFIEIQHILKST